MERPAQVNRAMTLLWSSLAISCAPAFFPGSELSFAPESLAWWCELALAAATVGITALLFYLVSRRRNWARILLLVLFVVGLSISVATLSWPIVEGWLSFAVYTFVAILQAFALYLLFTGNAATWFRQNSEGRPGAA